MNIFPPIIQHSLENAALNAEDKIIFSPKSLTISQVVKITDKNEKYVQEIYSDKLVAPSVLRRKKRDNFRKRKTTKRQKDNEAKKKKRIAF